MLRKKLSSFIPAKKQESSKLLADTANIINETVAGVTERMGGTLIGTKEKVGGAVNEAVSLASDKAAEVAGSVSSAVAMGREKLPKVKSTFRCPFSKTPAQKGEKITYHTAKSGCSWSKLFFAGLGITAVLSLVYLLKELFSPTGGAWVPHTASAPYLNEPLVEEELDELFKEN